MRGAELWEAQQVRPTVTHRAYLRNTTIESDWRLLIYGKRWNITPAINASVTTFAVAKVGGTADIYAPKLPFRVIVDDEIMIVTAVSGGNWTVTRGADGTTAASHLAGAALYDLRVLDIDAVLDSGNSNQLEFLLSENQAR